MKSRNLSISLLMLFLFLSGYGQSKCKQGYIIKNNNDTLYGLICLRSNYQNGRNCDFSEGENQAQRSFSPEDIKAYRVVNNKYYVSREIKLNNTRQRVFLEYLIDGIVDLYYYKDVINEYYFIERDSLVLLSNDLVKVFREGDGIRKNDKEYLINSNQYKGVLRYLFQDGQDVVKRISNTPFEYKSLINLTKDYHDRVCSDYKCVDYTKSTSRRLYIEPGIGIINTWMSLKTSKDNQYELKPYAGIQLRFTPMKIQGLWNFLTGFNYSTNNLSGVYDNSLFPTPTLPVDTHRIYTKYSALRVPLTIEYSLQGERFQPFLSLSYVNVFLINKESQVIRLYNGTSTEKISDMRGYQFGMSAGIGFKYKLKNGNYVLLKNEFEYRFPSANLRNILDYTRHKSWLISVGYGFKI